VATISPIQPPAGAPASYPPSKYLPSNTKQTHIHPPYQLIVKLTINQPQANSRGGVDAGQGFPRPTLEEAMVEINRLSRILLNQQERIDKLEQRENRTADVLEAVSKLALETAQSVGNTQVCFAARQLGFRWVFSEESNELTGRAGGG